MSILNPMMHPTDVFVWSWGVFRREWFILLILILSGGLIGGLGVGQYNALLGVVVGTLFGLFAGVLGGALNGGLDIIPNARRIITPNQEIWRSARLSLFIVLISLLFGLLFFYVNKFGIAMVAAASLGIEFGNQDLGDMMLFVRLIH